MRITLAQVASELGDLDANLASAAQIVRQAAAARSDLVVFPELFLTGYALGRVDEDVSLSADDERLTKLGAITHADVLIGLYEDGLGVHNYNSAAYYDANGLVHSHRKLYLPTYDVFEERKHFSPGQSMRAYDTRHGRMATLICNDAWQPHLAFLAVQDGAREIGLDVAERAGDLSEGDPHGGARLLGGVGPCRTALRHCYPRRSQGD